MSRTNIFQKRNPCNALNFTFRNPLQVKFNNINITTLIDDIKQVYEETTAKILKAFRKHKSCYDGKTCGQSLLLYCVPVLHLM